MKNSTKLLLCQIITSSIVAFVMLVIWIGVFFGETYPEIRVKETFLATSCTVVSRSVISSKCCTKDCTHCSLCSGTDTCDSLAITLSINSTASCCNGYKCCDTCCDRCYTCTGSGSSKSCYYRDCNCRCCSSVSNLQCTITCKECWTPTVIMQYATQSNSTVQSKMSKTCGSDYTCVDQYLDLWPLNQTSTCFYNPQNTQEFATTNEYTPYKFGVMYAFAALTIISVIWLLIVLVISLGLCLQKNGFLKIEFTKHGGGSSSYNPAHTTSTFNDVTITKIEQQQPASTSTQPLQPMSTSEKKFNEPTVSEVYQPPVTQPNTGVVGGNGFYEPTGNEPVTTQPYVPYTESQPVGGYSNLPYPPNSDFNPYQPSYPVMPNNYGGNTQNSDQYISYGPTSN